MNSEPEAFDDLRKLLALKRHELPPPGYFHRFSSDITDRIQAGSLAQESGSLWAVLVSRFGLDLDMKPACVCALGVLVAGLMAVGVISSQSLSNSGRGPAFLTFGVAGLPGSGEVSRMPGWESSASMSSTAPVMAQSSPFTHLINHTERARFNVLLVGN